MQKITAYPIAPKETFAKSLQEIVEELKKTMQLMEYLEYKFFCCDDGIAVGKTIGDVTKEMLGIQKTINQKRPPLCSR